MIFVTGGKGFIGSSFVRKLVELDVEEEIFIIDNDSYAANQGNIIDLLNGVTDEAGNFHPSKVECMNFDICNEAAMLGLFDAYEPEFVINFAAHTHVDRSIDNDAEFFRTNVEGVRVLLKCVNVLNDKKKTKHCQMLQISTDEVYGSVERDHVHIDSAHRPGNPYAASKSAAEMLCKAYINTYRTPVHIVNMTNVYGPRQHDEKFIPTVIRALQQGKPVPLYGTGSNIRQWMFVDDCVTKLIQLLRAIRVSDLRYPNFCNVHIAPERNEPLSNLDITRLIAEIMEVKPLIVQFVPDRPGHDFRYQLRNTNSGGIYTPIAEGLKRTIEWYKTR